MVKVWKCINGKVDLANSFHAKNFVHGGNILYQYDPNIASWAHATLIKSATIMTFFYLIAFFLWGRECVLQFQLGWCVRHFQFITITTSDLLLYDMYPSSFIRAVNFYFGAKLSCFQRYNFTGGY